ncbi:hypothetical protein E4T80_09740 [Muribacter muris]|uniref:Uncharacterized protein n=1 Tax=Muribacter muris TaxID=67855 RepID=A0A4Y9JTB3_9PAST|nr:hypothetical protein [Muribacter muris]MBF0785739.1 hypothetical protein [Muribacter muris]MBF0828289.1 hypothetical protein [Muribacter muris]TFV08562.1 hypothetical protein E4T80_09740 [Muribacter muris]
MRKLLAPLNYLRIFHKEKFYFDVLLPIILTSLIVVANYYLPQKLSLLGDKGFVAIVNGILQILTGFYIASLAAISTASLPRLDEEMRGEKPIYLWGKEKPITRRRFLTSLFGYLSFVSLITYFIGGLAQIAEPNIINLISKYEVSWIFSGLKITYLLIICNLLFVTILGLFFMIEDNINKPTLPH